MEEILIQAALREVDKIRIIRDYHAHSGAFQLGELIFYIRRRLERMIFIYQRCLRIQAMHFEILREMHIVYMEIDHLMEMLEEFDIYDRDNPTESSVSGGAMGNMPGMPGIPGMPPGMHPGMPAMPHRGARRTHTSAPSAEEPIKRTVNKDDEPNNLRRRQIAYLERKMVLRNMARGLGKTTSPRKKKKQLDYEDGFESDKL